MKPSAHGHCRCTKGADFAANTVLQCQRTLTDGSRLDERESCKTKHECSTLQATIVVVYDLANTALSMVGNRSAETIRPPVFRRS
jgi:hypothetical protein